jgi:hypothetical protein
MKRNTSRQATKVKNGAIAIKEYVSLLNEVYPPGEDSSSHQAGQPSDRECSLTHASARAHASF